MNLLTPPWVRPRRRWIGCRRRWGIVALALVAGCASAGSKVGGVTPDDVVIGAVARKSADTTMNQVWPYVYIFGAGSIVALGVTIMLGVVGVQALKAAIRKHSYLAEKPLYEQSKTGTGPAGHVCAAPVGSAELQT